MKIKEIHRIAGEIECVTGLHIGGSKDHIEIGGMDQPIIKNPLNQAPYIPGSSLKGKMRSMLELFYFHDNLSESNKGNAQGKPCGCAQKSCMVCLIFGTANNNKPKDLGPTRIVVRDAVLTDEFQDRFDSGDLLMEEKNENTINRITGTAENPRPLERVPAGVCFSFSITLKRMQDDPDNLLDWVWKGLRLIELDGLGGSISRGSAQAGRHAEGG